jgi:hypothetical protein
VAVVVRPERADLDSTAGDIVELGTFDGRGDSIGLVCAHGVTL